MDHTVEQVERYGRDVFEHTEMDALRKTECLCLNCENIDNCEIARRGFELCTEYGMAYATTRCPLFSPKPDSPLIITS